MPMWCENDRHVSCYCRVESAHYRAPDLVRVADEINEASLVVFVTDVRSIVNTTNELESYLSRPLEDVFFNQVIQVLLPQNRGLVLPHAFLRE